jgi:hypothetical protein
MAWVESVSVGDPGGAARGAVGGAVGGAVISVGRDGGWGGGGGAGGGCWPYWTPDGTWAACGGPTNS